VALDEMAKIEAVDLIDDGVRWYAIIRSQYLDLLMMNVGFC
jgi:hypothetical protein